MKKITLSMAIAMLFALASCQKEKAVTKTVIDTPPPAAKTIKVSSNFDYVELTPISRQPGENFDSYVANFHGCFIKLQGPGSYNFEKYPNLVDGVPVVAASLSTYDGTSYIQSVNSGTDGNVFEVTQNYLGGVPSFAFQGDISTYFSAVSSWLQNGSLGGQPVLGSYVKASYSGEASTKTYTGKIIRIKLGSHLAIADVTYPLPQPAPPTPTPILNKGFFITDSQNPTIAYYIAGVKGTLVSSDKVTVVNNTFDFTNSVKVLVNGSYTHVLNTGTFHYWGAIKRLDGSLFSFDVTEDTD